MKLEIEVHESDVVDQTEYAERLRAYAGGFREDRPSGFELAGKASNGKCPVKDPKGRGGVFNLENLTIEWDDGEEYDVGWRINEIGYTLIDVAEDFGSSSLMWGVDNSGGEPTNVLFGIN